MQYHLTSFYLQPGFFMIIVQGIGFREGYEVGFHSFR
jgi:hypothetical protein